MGRKKLIKIISFAVVFTVILSCGILLKVSGGYAVYTKASAKRELPIYSVKREDKKVAISFDCAWGCDYTEKILDCLDEYNVKCTFFAVQFWTEKNPGLIKEIVDRGHEIGTHSATHPKMSGLSADKILTELQTSVKAIEKITKKRVELFRAPFGDYNDTVISTAKRLGLYTIQWSVDSLDWKDLSKEKIAERVISKTDSGDIILCHNNGLHTLEALPLIFENLQSKGFVFEPIGQLIYKNDYKILSDGTQVKNENI